MAESESDTETRTVPIRAALCHLQLSFATIAMNRLVSQQHANGEAQFGKAQKARAHERLSMRYELSAETVATAVCSLFDLCSI